MRVKVVYDTNNAKYLFESHGCPQRVLRELAVQARMCDKHARDVDRRIKADEYREANRAQS